MSQKPERAGWLYQCRHCLVCGFEITDTDWVIVDEDGEFDGEGWIDRTTVRHAGECPKEDAA